MPFVIRSLLKSLLVLAVAVPVMALFPLAALSLCRTPGGAQLLFWMGPWSCCLWVLLYSQLSASKFWLGAEHVRQWREEQGGLLVASAWATCWMFGALFFSYVAEGAFLFTTRSLSPWLPAATYSPLALCWLWRHSRCTR
jgi:hypothetical protein